MEENGDFVIRYHSDYCDNTLLQKCETLLEEYQIQYKKIDLKGYIVNGALDFVDYDLIAISYTILQSFFLSGLYDVLKQIFINLWTSIRPEKVNRVPWTFRIEGIPTVGGKKNIAIKVTGHLNNEQKKLIINRVFDLANNIQNNSYRLKRQDKYYDIFNAHVININPETLEVQEINIEEELRKKTDS